MLQQRNPSIWKVNPTVISEGVTQHQCRQKASPIRGRVYPGEKAEEFMRNKMEILFCDVINEA